MSADFLGAFIVQEANWAFGGYTACYLGVGTGIVEWVKAYLRIRTGKGYAQVSTRGGPGCAPEGTAI